MTFALLYRVIIISSQRDIFVSYKTTDPVNLFICLKIIRSYQSYYEGLHLDKLHSFPIYLYEPGTSNNTI